MRRAAAAELERKQEYEHLSESEQRYRVFVLLNTDAMWRIEFEQPISTKLPEEQQIEQIYRYGYLAECNDAAARYYGLEKASQLTGWRVNDLARSPTLAYTGEPRGYPRRVPLHHGENVSHRMRWQTALHAAQPVGNRRRWHVAAHLGHEPRYGSHQHRTRARCL